MGFGPEWPKGGDAERREKPHPSSDYVRIHLPQRGRLNTVPSAPSGCTETSKRPRAATLQRIASAARTIQAILCNQSRPECSRLPDRMEPRRGVRGKNNLIFPPAAFRRFRRAKAAPCPLHPAATKKRRPPPTTNPLTGNVSGNILLSQHPAQNLEAICSNIIHNTRNFLHFLPLQFVPKHGILSPYQKGMRTTRRCF